MSNNVEFQDLLGEHLLTGIDMGTMPRKEYDYEAANTVDFIIATYDGLFDSLGCAYQTYQTLGLTFLDFSNTCYSYKPVQHDNTF